ncbi:MAG: DNA methyltransferase [Deltaproteobacteria bacterium]|nr:DNA methyltransferase [Deltaproteobacteria bacterium]
MLTLNMMSSPPGAGAGSVRFVELFCGIGGMACAARAHGARVVLAVDQDRAACETYRRNHGMAPSPRNICNFTARELIDCGADGWLLSPPCQPFTRKGKGLDDADPRTLPLLHLIDLLPRCRPALLFLENVPPFAGSRTHGRLLAALAAADLHPFETIVCPTDLGIPNRRRRYYLLARRTPLDSSQVRLAGSAGGHSLAAYLDPDAGNDLVLSPRDLERLAGTDIIEPDGIAACFGSSYGHALRRSGSYLAVPHMGGTGVRRFSPDEILRLLHFPGDFSFPPALTAAQRYRLAGNSVNVAVVERLLKILLNG